MTGFRGAVLVLGLFAAAAATTPQSTRFDFPELGDEAADLQARAAAQQRVIEASTVQADFTFVDRLVDSGITFRHRVVADAAENYKAAHYDHGNGLGVADVDGDGRVDLYFVNQIGANELWRNVGGGRFEDITERAGVGLADRVSVGTAFADIDNDGDPDLFVTSVRGGNALFRNDGAGRFRDITEEAGVAYSGHSSGATFVDYDGDGLLDLFVANVGRYTTDELGPGGFYRALEDAFEGHLYSERSETSRWYRNVDGTRFEDVTESLEWFDDAWNGDATLVDFNRDGQADIYVLNMQGEDRYYENRGGSFALSTAEWFPRTPYGAMGVKAFDYDNDLDTDLLVTDMHSDMNYAQAGVEESEKQRIRYFYQDASVHLMGNALYRNDGATFAEVSGATGMETYWPWGISVADVNADGWQDVFLAQSMNYPFRYQPNALKLNAGGVFVDAAFVVGLEPRVAGTRQPWFGLDCAGVDRAHDHCTGREDAIEVWGARGSRSSAFVDLDGDGDLDLVTSEFNGAPQILMSDLAERHSIGWLEVVLKGTTSNRDGLGATVTVHADGHAYQRWVDGKSGYLSQNVLPHYFGLADARSVERIEVLWPSGTRQVVEGPIDSGQRLVVTEASGR